jgi:NAD(P)-dependent dehydrogenase (short-subunit alcohol dehydrogenase family)
VSVTFEARRLYVAPRKSVLFFARVGDQRVRCYVQQDALIEPARGLREDADVYQRCLLAYDHHRDLIQAAARRLIEAKVGGLDGVVVSSAALALQAEAPLAALDSAR